MTSIQAGRHLEIIQRRSEIPLCYKWAVRSSGLNVVCLYSYKSDLYYGLELLAKDPNLTKAQIVAKLKQKKIDTESGQGAVTTAIAQFKKIYKLLGENGHLK